MADHVDIAFITSEQQPEITIDDVLLKNQLELLDVQVTGVPWTAEGVNWERFNLLVLRSCWDYFHRHTDFLAWLSHLKRMGISLWNPIPVVRWNYEKTYLRELQQLGIPIVPSVYAPIGKKTSIIEVLSQQAWDRVVIKPTISGTSLHTWVGSRVSTTADQARLDTLTDGRSMILQPYLPEIETVGEWSLIFIDGTFSHAVRKVPRSGDFRVQHDFGGTWLAEEPGLHLRKAAEDLLRKVGFDLLYARVDGVVQNGIFLLMELELIEPVLFFAAAPLAAKKFATALVQRIQKDVRD